LVRRKAHNLGYKAILKKANTIDFVHLNICFPAGLFALHLKKKYKIPFIISEHWTVFLESDPFNFTPLEQYFANKIIRTADMLCPVSDDLKKALEKITSTQQFKVIPNVVDTNIFKPTTTKADTKKIKILHLSNLKDNHKNICGIINAIKKLSEQRTDFILTIAGDGDAEKYKKQQKKLNIPEDLILFEGEKTTQEVAQLMSDNDCFLLFSNYENLPCVIVESLAMGIPVLATNVGGISEMINPSNGIVIESKNEVALLEKLDLLINSIDTYDKVTIATNAKKIYSYETVGKQFFDIYNKILTV